MFGWLTLHVLALLLVAVQFGGILLFAAMVTPLVFRHLPAETAALFLRGVFPVYYRVMGILALVAALPLVPGQSYMGEISALVAVALGYVVLNTILRPAAEKARDENRRGAFRRLHRLSVAVHLVQFAVISVVLVRLAQ
ncbi:MAG: DUF4149 domain-containing protein [Methyloligellaceae bacterium]